MTINTNGEKIRIFLNSTELTQDGTPTPDNPIDVNVITGSNNIKITDGTEEQNYPITLSSKNLLDFDNINVKRLGTKGTVTVEKDKIIFSAASSDVYGVIVDLAGLNLKNNTTYTVSNLMNNTDSNVRPSGWRYYNGSSYTVLNNFRNYFTFTTTESGINQLLYYVGTPAAYDGTLTLYDIQLLEGAILQADVPNYAPYIANPLEYCKIGDYADQIFKNIINSPYYDNTLNENEWYMKKNIGKVVLDGSDTWYLALEGTNTNLYYNQRTQMSSDVLSNYFTRNENLYTEDVEGIRGLPNNNRIWIRINKTIGSNVNSFKSWLTTHNTEVYYVLNTSEYINITENYPTLATQLETLNNNAKSYDDETNITQTNDGLPFNITYELISDDTEGKIRDVVYDINEFLRVNL